MEKTELSSEKQDYSISMVAANVYSLLIAVPMLMVIIGLYIAVWGLAPVLQSDMPPLQAGFFIFLMIVGVFIHEGLHAIGWQVFGQLPRGSVKFGFHLKTLTPYAHCTKLLNIHAYRMGGFLPGLALGFVPAVIGIVTGSGPSAAYGLLFSIAASGDLLSLWTLRNVPSNSLVEDHPSRVGCYVYPPHTEL